MIGNRCQSTQLPRDGRPVVIAEQQVDRLDRQIVGCGALRGGGHGTFPIWSNNSRRSPAALPFGSNPVTARPSIGACAKAVRLPIDTSAVHDVMQTANRPPANPLKLARPGGLEPPAHSSEGAWFPRIFNGGCHNDPNMVGIWEIVSRRSANRP